MNEDDNFIRATKTAFNTHKIAHRQDTKKHVTLTVQ